MDREGLGVLPGRLFVARVLKPVRIDHQGPLVPCNEDHIQFCSL